MNKNKLLVFLLLIGMLTTTVFVKNFFHYFLEKNYSVDTYTSCNPAEKNCFKLNDDLKGLSFNIQPYYKVSMEARYAPKCLEEHTCVNFKCPAEDESCTVIYCSTDKTEDGESCTQ